LKPQFESSKPFPGLKMVLKAEAEVDHRDVTMKRKAELQEQHRKSDLFFAPFDPRFPNQNQTRSVRLWTN